MANTAPQLADAARALSWGLRVGVMRVPDVIGWVDGQIGEVDEVPQWMLDLSMMTDINSAISTLAAASENHDFGNAFGLLAVLADRRIREAGADCHFIIASLVRLHTDEAGIDQTLEGIGELYMIEDELSDGCGSEDEARTELRRLSDRFVEYAITLGLVS